MTLSELLKAIQGNPDDLSKLPEIIAKVESLEGSITDYQDRINKLQDINKSYLAQIPIPGQETKKEETTEAPTLEDAKQHIIEALGGK